LSARRSASSPCILDSSREQTQKRVSPRRVGCICVCSHRLVTLRRSLLLR
jgi:hypothetical protein